MSDKEMEAINMLRILIVCIAGLLSATAYGADLETVIVAPSEPVQAGEKVEFEVYFINPTDHSILVEARGQLSCRLIGDNKPFEVNLTPTTGGLPFKTVISANGFLKETYSLDMPESLNGNVHIELVQFASKRVLFCVQPTDRQPEKVAAEMPQGKDTFESIQCLFQPKFPYLPAYEPIYFSVGTDPEKSKFQFSFKYRFIDPQGKLAKKYPLVSSFYFGYTQTSLWNLQAESKPFEDTSYKPELFFLSQNIDLSVPWISFFCIQAGLQHESNGQDDPESRSTNYLYAKPIFAFDVGADYHLKVAPKVWVYMHNDDDTNPDLAAYRGYFDLGLKFGKSDSFVLGSNLRYGTKGGSMQFDGTYPLFRAIRKIFFLKEDQDSINPNIYLHAQYYNGYAETLLDYNKKDHALRFGIAFVR